MKRKKGTNRNSSVPFEREHWTMQAKLISCIYAPTKTDTKHRTGACTLRCKTVEVGVGISVLQEA